MDLEGNERKRKNVETGNDTDTVAGGPAATKRVKKGEGSTSNISEIQHGLQTIGFVVADSHRNSIHDAFRRSMSSSDNFPACLVISGASKWLDGALDGKTSAQIPPIKMDLYVASMIEILSEIRSACKSLFGSKDETLPDLDQLRERVRSQDAKGLGELAQKVTNIVNELSPEEWVNQLNKLVQDPLFQPRTSGTASQHLEGGNLYRSEQEQATVDAWNVPYQGSMHRALWEHIKGLAADQESYAHACAIIQSSGTGKSRMVDQLGEICFVIPICLREPREPGFPPSDDPVRSYFLASMRRRVLASGKQSNDIDVMYARRRLDAFFKVLFDKTFEKLQVLEQALVGSVANNEHYSKLASSFRKAMTKGQTFTRQSQFRSRFYKDVVESADAMVESCRDSDGDFVSDVTSAFGRLSSYILARKESSVGEESSAKQQKGDRPLVVIAFDESGVLSEPGEAIPVLDILRSRLSKLKHLSLFTLFISTTGQIAQSFRYDSMRIVSQQAKLCPAFTGCVFDEFALRPSPPRKLESAATERYMLHLGRPLWATRISPQTCKLSSDSSMFSLPSHPALGAKSKSLTSNSLRRHAVEFAVAKLLNMSYLIEFGKWSLTNEQCLACLAQRLPIEILPASFVSEQQKLVESHMRICLRVDPSTKTMTTFSASEPILAEAAFVVMKNPNANILMSLQRIFDGFAVHPGERGGLVGHLLLLLARDDAVSEQNNAAMWTTMSLPVEMNSGVEELSEWKRIITVPNFIKSLFVQQHIPQDVLNSLEKDFDEVYVHFNHFVKAIEDDVASPPFLLGLLTRGAGLICATNQEAIDGVIPCVKDGDLERKNIRHIIIQIRNRKNSRKSADWKTIHNFGRVALKYAADNNVPVIRILLNLGAKFPLFKCKVTREREKRKNAYTAIDFYCAGLSAEYLKPIANRKDSPYWREETWQGLLDTTRSWEHRYEPPIRSSKPELDRYLWEMTPGVGTNEEFWGFLSKTVD